jgi:hypothetical protein
VILFMLRLVLAGAPDNTPGLTRISYLTRWPSSWR